MSERIRHSRFLNLIYTTLLLGGLLAIPAILAIMAMGKTGLFMLAIMWMTALLFGKRLSPRAVLRMAGAREIDEWEAPRLNSLVRRLSNEAGLSVMPRIFLIEKPVLNAFTTGSRKNPCIAVSHGLLHHLDSTEVSAVLAHEIGHIRNNDLLLLAFSDGARRMSSVLASVIFFLIIAYLPLAVFSGVVIPLLPLLLVLAAPTASNLILLAISRTREFGADLEAARLMHGPHPLIDALKKIEHSQTSWIERLVNFRLSNAVPEMLRTHPSTTERIARLKELEPLTGRSRVTVEPSSKPLPPFTAFVLNRGNHRHGPQIRVLWLNNSQAIYYGLTLHAI